MLVKQVQLKPIKGGKSKISSSTLLLFLPGEINMNENRVRTEIHNGNCLHLFSGRSEILGTPPTAFQHYHPDIFHVVCNAKLCILPILVVY